MTPTVHIVEPGGWGGVYHHAASLAEGLRAMGVGVMFHSAADAEAMPCEVAPRPCFWRFGPLRPALLRRSARVGGWLAAGIPSVLGSVRRGEFVHIEGRFKPPLLVPLVHGARLRGCSVTFSPHTTFSRDGRLLEERIVHGIARRADAVFAFSEHDVRQIESWGARAVRAPVLVPSMAPEPPLISEWRHRWGGEGRPVVLLAGQLRADKGLDVLVQAAAVWHDEFVVAVVGEDLGALGAGRRLARELDVTLEVDAGYQPLRRFIAALAAADVVACPYRVGSQSAILAMARALGKPTVATGVGGLAELATVVVPPADPEALAWGVRSAARARSVAGQEPLPERIHPYLQVFGAARAGTVS